MASKNNIRSFRYSDEVARILEQQPGESLNAKFENLVVFCFNQLERRQAELDRIDAQIEQRRRTLANLEDAAFEMLRLEHDLKTARDSLSTVSRRAKEIAARFEES